jgi:hypothetical protein
MCRLAGAARLCLLASFLVLGAGGISLAASVTVSPDAVLTLPGSAGFGGGVALSADGNTLIVGNAFTGQGSAGGRFAALFTRSAGTWQPQAHLGVKGQPTGAVALSADGDEVLVGEFRGGNGFADVFSGSGGSWRQTRTFGRFSGVLALSGDGRTVALGVRIGRFNLGEVDLYARAGRGWVSAGRVTGNSATGFGDAVALSFHGDVLFVGDAGAGAAPGVVYVYRRAGSRWLTQTSLHQPNSSSRTNGFGTGVATSWSATTVLVGASPNPPAVGYAYVFTEVMGRWSVRARLGIRGQNVGGVLSGDGQRAVIAGGFSGAPTADLYAAAGGRWMEQAHLAGKAPARNALVTTDSALSFDGSTVALGAAALSDGLFGSNRHAPGAVDVFH